MYTIEPIKTGFNNETFLLRGLNEVYIARVGKSQKDSGSSLVNAYRSVRFLEENGISFVPRIIEYIPEHDILIETFVGDSDASLPDLDASELDTYIQQLVRVHRFTEEEVNAFCTHNGLESFSPQHIDDVVEMYGIERYHIVAQLCPDQKIIQWIKSQLDTYVILARSMQGNTCLHQGDIGSNIRRERDIVYD